MRKRASLPLNGGKSSMDGVGGIGRRGGGSGYGGSSSVSDFMSNRTASSIFKDLKELKELKDAKDAKDAREGRDGSSKKSGRATSGKGQGGQGGQGSGKGSQGGKQGSVGGKPSLILPLWNIKPAIPLYILDETVDGQYKLANGTTRWYPGRIIAVNPNGSYDIRYLDGDIHLNKDNSEIRMTKNWKLSSRSSRTSFSSTDGNSQRDALAATVLSVRNAVSLSVTGPDGPGGLGGVDGTDGPGGVGGVDGTDGPGGVGGVDRVDGVDGVDGTDGTGGVGGMDDVGGLEGSDVIHEGNVGDVRVKLIATHITSNNSTLIPSATSNKSTTANSAISSILTSAINTTAPSPVQSPTFNGASSSNALSNNLSSFSVASSTANVIAPTSTSPSHLSSSMSRALSQSVIIKPKVPLKSPARASDTASHPSPRNFPPFKASSIRKKSFYEPVTNPRLVGLVENSESCTTPVSSKSVGDDEQFAVVTASALLDPTVSQGGIGPVLRKKPTNIPIMTSVTKLFSNNRKKQEKQDKLDEIKRVNLQNIELEYLVNNENISKSNENTSNKENIISKQNVIKIEKNIDNKEYLEMKEIKDNLEIIGSCDSMPEMKMVIDGYLSASGELTPPRNKSEKYEEKDFNHQVKDEKNNQNVQNDGNTSKSEKELSGDVEKDSNDKENKEDKEERDEHTSVSVSVKSNFSDISVRSCDTEGSSGSCAQTFEIPSVFDTPRQESRLEGAVTLFFFILYYIVVVTTKRQLFRFSLSKDDLFPLF